MQPDNLSSISPSTAAPSFRVVFRPYFLQLSFCETGAVVFLTDGLVVTGDLVTQTFLPMLHFFTFFTVVALGNVVAGATGMAIGALLGIMLGIVTTTLVNRYLKGVHRFISYTIIRDVAVEGSRITFNCLNQAPAKISFRVSAEDCEHVYQEMRQRFPVAFMVKYQ